MCGLYSHNGIPLAGVLGFALWGNGKTAGRRERDKEYSQKKLNEDPKCPDAPALLNAMANLSRQKLLDYRMAVQYYELPIADYPDWDGIARVYPQLVTCYERSGDIHGMQDVCKRT